MLAQFVGGIAGVFIATILLRSWLRHPTVNQVETLPSEAGWAVAFFAEAVITFVLTLTVLTVSNQARLARFTGLFAGTLVATYITLEAPLSGMSMNPARTFASATGWE